MSTLSPQAVVKTRRDYNTWVANETMEDYALRFAPRAFRKWSEFRVANTAFGSVSFLVLEAIGGSLVINYGFTNALWAILIVGLVVFLTSLPISYYAARHNVDMDLLTRGAGFGYIGSTLTSLIYAAFTFTLFALEAAIMAQALQQYFDISLSTAYLWSALIVIPFVLFGVTVISRLQLWTQPLWLILMFVPYVAVLLQEPDLPQALLKYGGHQDTPADFDWLLFGSAATVAFAMVVQIGEQVDFLRFLPELTPATSRRWWLAILVAGPGWIVLGMLRQLGGALFAVLAMQHGVLTEHAHEPAQMYRIAYGYVFNSPELALAVTTLHVVVSQLKINVTNAYAGSLAWSNFFSRLTHSHPGRVVWLVFNVMIALLLMELGAFDRLEEILGLLSNVAIAWIGALVADLVINKPLGWSPPGIEFKRANLADFNPVGVVATLVASVLAVLAYLGLFGPALQAFAPVVALGTAMMLAPLIAWWSGGRFYLAKRTPACRHATTEGPCSICSNQFESADVTYCPVYQGTICSLCCTLDARCQDACKPGARWADQVADFAQRWLPRQLSPGFRVRFVHFMSLFIVLSLLMAAALGAIYLQDFAGLLQSSPVLARVVKENFIKVYATISVLAGLGAWWVVLNNESRQIAQTESSKQTALLIQEIEEHRKTDRMLKQAREAADRANQAKSRFLSDMSHEIRTPLNSIIGYSEILCKDPGIPSKRHVAVHTIQRSGEYLAALVEDILDIARIEARKFELHVAPIRCHAFIEQLMQLFAPQAEAKGLSLRCQLLDPLPEQVRGDERRVRQIMVNLLNNAIKFTPSGSVVLRVGYRSEIARFEVVDTGSGIPEERTEDIFQPFLRLNHAHGNASPGSGLGLTISKILTEIMGGEITVDSTPGIGSTFGVRLFLPDLHGEPEAIAETRTIIGYRGARRRILIVDDQPAQCALMMSLLEPLGFKMHQALSGTRCFEQVQSYKYDVILLDINLADTDGFTIARELRSRYYAGSIIVVSANAYQSDRQRAVAAGCDDFIAKPVRIDQLLGQLHLHLGLDWLYEGESGESVDEAAPIVLPEPGPALSQLRQWARMGDLGSLTGAVESLAESDARYEPLATHVMALARDFRLGDLKRLICGTQA